MKIHKMKIVCGTDFSSTAAQAATAAAAIAVKLKEVLTLVHIMEPAPLELIEQNVLDSIITKTRIKLREEADRLRRLGAKVEEHFSTGSAYELLAEFGHFTNVRMIVVASARRSATERWLVGSVAERVAQSALVPTIIVRDAVLLESWAAGGRPLKIFVASDFTHSSDAPLLWAGWLQNIGRCSITVAYVNWIPGDNTRLGMHGPISFMENSTELQAILERDMHGKAEKLIGSRPVKVSVEPGWGRTDAHLVEMARREEADLIVVGSHQRQGARRLFVESISRGILHRAPVNIAIVPASGAALKMKATLPETKRVLVTTDFSELANNAIPFAYSLLSCGGQVCLTHVVHPFELPNPLIANYQPSRPNKRQFKVKIEKLTKQLRNLVPPEAESRGIQTEVQVIEKHSPATGVCEAAERFGADVICIGSHGRSGISKALLGSVAQAILAKSSRPVLVVRPPKA